MKLSKHFKTVITCAGLAVGGVVATQLMSTTHFIQLLNLKAYDAQFVLRGKRPTTGVILIGIDAKSKNRYSDLLAFWHPYYADAIRAAGAGGAKVVALDVAFGIPVDKWAPGADAALSQAVSDSSIPAIIGYVPSLLAKQRDWPVPVNMVAAALGLGAFSNLTADSDDFIRNQELIEAAAPGDDNLAHSFALRIAEKYTGTDAQFTDGKLTLNGRPVPITADRAIAINYAGPADTFPRVSLCDFIDAYKAGHVDQLKSWVLGKAVLIGPDDVEDRYSTPFFTSFGGTKWTTAGVEIHANTVETLLRQNFLLPLPVWGRYLALLLVAAATVAFGVAMALGRTAVWTGVVLLVALAGTQALFRAGWILSAAEIALCWLCSLVATIVYRFAVAEKRRDLFRQAVSMFVGTKVATTLDETRKISLTGSRQNVTILFTDIRGFTAFCEEKDPAVIVDLLNHYMQTMVSIVVRYHGHVNKFIGDGILAVFSDEDNSTPGDHALRAVRCATEMVTVPGQFETGAGLHTGPVVVGNVGSQDKMEYTVLGDTVNLASRLESLNKENHTKLLMSGVTHDQLLDQVETKHLGSVPVRGKSVPIDLYTVAMLVPAGSAK